MAHKSRQKIIFLVLLSMVISFGIGALVGFKVQVKKEISDDEGILQISKVLNLYSSQSKDVEFDQFWDVWDIIQEGYVDQPVEDADLFYGAIEGLVRGLGDPYSQYFPPVEAKAFADNLSGEFDGIGAEIGIREEQLTIIAPLPNSPAEKSGLRSGDMIFAIDELATHGLSLEEAVTKIRGKKGTEVVLTIAHLDEQTSQKISISRDTIVVPTIIAEKEESGLQYIRIGHFNEETWSEFDSLADELVLAPPPGIILDLRSNPGGFLDTAVKVASEWVMEGPVVRERFQDDQVRDYLSRGKHRLSGIPTVVLVDQGSASASEIVAGALQDYDVATVIGTQTFGKGSVQTLEPLPDGSALKLTIAKWFTPHDRQIHEIGIEPDEIMEETIIEDEHAPEGFVDLARERAREILK